MNGMYPEDFPEGPVAGIADDEVEDFLVSIGRVDAACPVCGSTHRDATKLVPDESHPLGGWFCGNDWHSQHTRNALNRLHRAADLLDGDR